MIVDFHVHTRASRDSGMDSARVLEHARRAGLGGIALCDHGTADAALEVAASPAAEGLLVIVGEEVRTTEGEIIGLFLAETVASGLTPEATVARIREQGGVVCVPHPFDRFRRSPLSRAALERIAGSVDVIEGLNGRNLRHADDAEACSWAAGHGLPVVAGSDAHTYGEIGRARTRLPAFSSAATLIEALGQAVLVGGHSSPSVHVATAIRKRWPW